MRYLLIPCLLFLASPVADAAGLSASQARACEAMAATFAPKRAEFETLTDLRDTLAARAEIAGDEWEAAEAFRNFSRAQAAEADLRRAEYDDATERFDRSEEAYRVLGAQLNQDIADYNAACATKK